ncbi:caspase-like [Zeugodacus cucurbitae]|uniref:caspase-like n=1 Tax=Zeugodacus cucurbitae TaxID=28588 RepID=UPI0023D92E29|nr:caspase-like [Zeugodacus cucurbitae]XP_011196255.2 caspase-like [Zeugodacus cucurbitae]XP_011196266.2 caspase-like [Zeugodacus cucurbitae]XP_011196274.2 caspase-like [Zeugodacus cucurbitae]XP_011196283.2 caspase-like [Zeugodacus cucurbitae]
MNVSAEQVDDSSLSSSSSGSTDDEHNFVGRYRSCTANMATDRDAVEYNMRHKNRGLALIFNHETFDVRTIEPRTGTNVDCENLTKVLKKLDFDVNVFNDCRLNELKQQLVRASQMDHSENDCILVVILSHGEHGYIYAKDVQYKLDAIWSYFTPQKCPSLAGKPKLFFIQACQGDECDPGVTLNRHTETDGDSSMSYKIPLYADFLIAYSTIPGFVSWRNPELGSWFIHALYTELEMNGKRLDILTLLTFVCRRVAIDWQSYAPDTPKKHEQKQIPCFTSMLTRILRFGERRASQ